VGRLDGRVALITGAARGIGEATARLFAAEGARVALVDRDAEPLHEVAASLGDAAVAVVADCAVDGEAERVLAAALDAHGTVDIVVNNAGARADAPFHLMDDRQWHAVFDACLTATVRICQAVVPHFRDRSMRELVDDGQVAWHRKITNTAPASFLTGSPGQANLTAAGGAVVGLTRTLARELGGFGVNVNAVAPGFVDTRLTATQGPDGGLGVAEPLRQMTKAMTALGRYGQPADLARVHLFLASSDADFVTGVTIPVAGGLLGTCV
jgi:3-oxoacyl-[acyl-carrier protein] reductase